MYVHEHCFQQILHQTCSGMVSGPKHYYYLPRLLYTYIYIYIYIYTHTHTPICVCVCLCVCIGPLYNVYVENGLGEANYITLDMALIPFGQV